jgi:hypothetical protein
MVKNLAKLSVASMLSSLIDHFLTSFAHAILLVAAAAAMGESIPWSQWISLLDCNRWG